MIEQFADAWARVCLTYRKTILLVLAAVTVVTGSALSESRFDNGIEMWFLGDDPALAIHQRLVDTFGSDEWILIGVEAPDVFAPAVLERIDRITHAVEEVPNVEKVFSLTKVEAIRGTDDALEVAELVRFPLDVAALPAIRERALANSLYVGNVVSADGHLAMILARLPYRSKEIDHKVAAVAAVRQILDDEGGGAGLYLAGSVALDAHLLHQSQIDSGRMIAMMLVILVLALWFLLRNVAAVVVALTTVVLTTIWTIGAMALRSVPANILTTLLPPLLLAIGVADVMHVIVEYQSRCREGTSKSDALRATYRELLGPLSLATLTTVIGMASLTVSRIRGIREFGAFSALGIAAAFFLSTTFVPIALSYFGRPRPRQSASRAILSTRVLESIHRFTVRHPRGIAVATAVAVALGALGATRVRAESAFLKMIRPSAPVRIDTERLQDAMGGTVTMEVIVDTGREGGVSDPAFLRQLAGLEEFLVSQPNVTSAQSVTGYFKDLRRAFFANDQREHRLPETQEEAAQYLLLYELDAPDGDIREYVTFDRRQARVSARVKLTSSGGAVGLVASTQQYVDRHFSPGVTATVGGLLALYAGMHEYIRSSLVQGFGGALVLIFIVFCFQMRSVSLGALVMIANSIPIVITLGIMGATGIRLDTMTAMVASITIGLADDDSIHFVSRVRSRLHQGADILVALRETLVEVGRALVFTGLALCAGFAVMLTAGFLPAAYFGLLTMLTILIALASDLLLLPVLLRWHDAVRQRTTQPLEELST